MQPVLKSTLVLLSVVLVLTTGCSKERKKRNHIAKAESFIAKEQFQRAEIELINAARIPPQTAVPFAKLGSVYLAQGRWGDAYGHFLRAAQLNTNEASYQVALANLAVEFRSGGDLSNAFRWASSAFKQAPTNGEALLLMSRAAYLTNMAAIALDAVNSSEPAFKNSALYHTARGNTLFRLRRAGEALQEYQAALKIDTNFVAAYEGVAEFESARRNVSGVGAALLRSSTLAPHRSPSRTRFAEFVARVEATNLVQTARGQLEETTVKAPDFIPAWLALAELNRLEGKHSDAAEALQKVTAIQPSHRAAILLRSQLFLDQGNVTNALTQLQKAASVYPKDPGILLQLAETQAKAKQTGDALATVSRVLAIQTNHINALFLQAQLNATTGNEVQAMAALNTVVKAEPRAREPRLLLADLYARRNEPQEANKHWDFLKASGRPDIGLLSSIANSQARSGLTNAAATTYLELAELQPTNAMLQYDVARNLLRVGFINESRRLLERLKGTETHLVLAQSALADIDTVQGNWNEAKQRINTLLQKTPEAFLYYQLGQVHVRHANALFYQSPEWKRFVANRTAVAKPSLTNNPAAREQLQLAEPALQKALELKPDLVQAKNLLGSLYQESGRAEDTLELLEDSLSETNTASLQETKALLLEQNKQYKEAAAAYEEVLKLDPNRHVSLNNLAAIYTEHLPNQSLALSLAERAYKLKPNLPPIQDTLGWLLVKQGDYKRGRELLQQANLAYKDEPDVMYHLGTAHYLLGDERSAAATLEAALQASRNPNKRFSKKAETERLLSILRLDPASIGADSRAIVEKSVAENPRDIVALVRLAAIDERSNQGDAALQKYEKALAEAPNYWPALFGAARVYASHRADYKKAFELANRARTINPGDPSLAHLLGSLAFKNGDHRYADTLLSEAANSPSLARNPQVSYDLAWAAYSVGRLEVAEGAMSAAAQSKDFNKADEAKAFLAASAAATNGARAVQFLPEAQKLVASNPDHLPALVAIAVANTERRAPKEAAQTYSTILAKYPRFAPAARSLAVISLLDLGDPANALALANKAREAYPQDPRLIATAEIAKHRLKQRPDPSALQRALNAGLPEPLQQEATRVLEELRQPPRKS